MLAAPGRVCTAAPAQCASVIRGYLGGWYFLMSQVALQGERFSCIAAAEVVANLSLWGLSDRVNYHTDEYDPFIKSQPINVRASCGSNFVTSPSNLVIQKPSCSREWTRVRERNPSISRIISLRLRAGNPKLG